MLRYYRRGMRFDWLYCKHNQVGEAVDYFRAMCLYTLRWAPNWPPLRQTVLFLSVWFFFDPETVGRDSY